MDAKETLAGRSTHLDVFAAGSGGRWVAAGRAAWVLVAALTLGLFVLGLPHRYVLLADRLVEVRRSGEIPPFIERWVFTELYPAFVLGIEAGFVILMALAAAVILWRGAAGRMTWLVSVALVSYAGFASPILGTLAREQPVWSAAVDAQVVVGMVSSIAALFVFPDGRFVPSWARYVFLAWIAWGLAAHFYFMPFVTDPGSLSLAVYLVPAIVFNVVVVGVQIYRYLRVSSQEERRRTKWVVGALSVGVAAYCVLEVSRVFASSALRDDLWLFLHLAIVFPLYQAVLAIIPVCILFALLRRGLFGADVLVNRALVYGALTLCVVGVYALVVGYLGNLFRVEDSLAVSLAATGIIAVAFSPLRDRLQRAANRLMYGERDEPYAVLSRLSRRLESSLAPEAVLPAIVETVAHSLKCPHAAVSLRLEDRFETAAEHGSPVGDPLSLPLVYNNETVGLLEVSPRGGSEPFGPADRRLLEDLARQAGVAAHAVRLTADLQRSRERLVTAREEERRRLRRDLHDGVGPRLAALTLKIETARNRLAHDPTAADLLSDLAERSREAVTDVRRSVHALRPPILDELGLIPALRETAAHFGRGFSVEAPDDLPPFPAAVEVAAYRIAQEAMTNVVRHAAARTCAVSLDLDEEAGVLRLLVEDDGRGMEPAVPGVGLHSMRERAEELGGTCVVRPGPAGGTRVHAGLPIGRHRVEGA